MAAADILKKFKNRNISEIWPLTFSHARLVRQRGRAAAWLITKTLTLWF